MPLDTDALRRAAEALNSYVPDASDLTVLKEEQALIDELRNAARRPMSPNDQKLADIEAAMRPVVAELAKLTAPLNADAHFKADSEFFAMVQTRASAILDNVVEKTRRKRGMSTKVNAPALIGQAKKDLEAIPHEEIKPNELQSVQGEITAVGNSQATIDAALNRAIVEQ